MSQTSLETDLSASESSDGSISQAVVEAVADAEGVDATELRVPLFDVIDPDALDAFFRSARESESASLSRIAFTYYGYEISVAESGTVTVEQ